MPALFCFKNLFYILLMKDLYQFIEVWMKESTFIYPVLLSLFSAYIFYLVFHVFPKRKEKKHIEDQLVYQTQRILHHILFIIYSAANQKIDQQKIQSKYLSNEEISNALTDVFMDDYLKGLHSNSKGERLKVGEAVANHIDLLKKEAEILFRYVYHLDTELIKSVNVALRNVFNESWSNSYQSPPFNTGSVIFTPVREDITKYASLLQEYSKIYREIEDYLFKSFPKHKSVLRRRFFYFFYGLNDYKKSLRTAKKLFNHSEYKKEASILIIKSNLKMNDSIVATEIAIKLLKNKLLIYEQLEESFKYDNAFSLSETESFLKKLKVERPI